MQPSKAFIILIGCFGLQLASGQNPRRHLSRLGTITHIDTTDDHNPVMIRQDNRIYIFAAARAWTCVRQTTGLLGTNYLAMFGYSKQQKGRALILIDKPGQKTVGQPYRKQTQKA